jgi:hypothetical protein
MKAANMQIEAAKINVDLAKGAAMPSLTLSGGVYTAYSSAAPKAAVCFRRIGNHDRYFSKTDYIVLIISRSRSCRKYRTKRFIKNIRLFGPAEFQP